MKKIAALIISTTLLLALVICASASLTPTTKCTLSSSEVEVGKSVTVTVSLEDCPNFQFAGITLEYDSGIFKLTNAEWLLENTTIKDFRTDNNQGVIALASERSGNGDIFKFTLIAKSKSVFDDNSISAKLTARSADNKNFTISAQKAKLTVIAAQTQTPTDTTTTDATTTAPAGETTAPTTTDTTAVDSTTTPDSTNTPETDGNKTTETTGKSESTQKTPVDNVEDGGNILGETSNKSTVIIIASIIGLLAIGICLYTYFKDNF